MTPGALLAFAFASATTYAQSSSQGAAIDGPDDQGACIATSASEWLCSSQTFCTWDPVQFNFSCVGAENDGAEQGERRGDSPNLLCELRESVWSCQSASQELSAVSGVDEGEDQCNTFDLGLYDLPLHIAALFIVLVSSAIGVSLPLISSSLMAKKAFRNIFFAAKYFGTGVIISTAFVHLLHKAFLTFSSVCIGDIKFEPVAAALAMTGTYAVFSIDYFVMRWLKTRAMNRAANAETSLSEFASQAGDPERHEKSVNEMGHSHGPAPDTTTDYASPQAHFDVLILEGGIIFHSFVTRIMIGVSLGSSGGSQWNSLLIAIVFHQIFEGLALGSRIGLLIWKAGMGWRKWAMASAFSLITPIGIAIGIGLHSVYNPNSSAALLSSGVLDSMSAGILVYAGLVEMLYHDFMHGELSNPRVSAARVTTAFFFLLAGTVCMSIVGIWA